MLLAGNGKFWERVAQLNGGEFPPTPLRFVSSPLAQVFLPQSFFNPQSLWITCVFLVLPDSVRISMYQNIFLRTGWWVKLTGNVSTPAFRELKQQKLFKIPIIIKILVAFLHAFLYILFLFFIYRVFVYAVGNPFNFRATMQAGRFGP